MNTTKIIRKIAKTLASSYTFPGYTEDDIEQEAFIMGVQALPRWNPKKSSLTTFLYTHINNRLYTLKRDKFINIIKNKEKFKLLYPIPIESVRESLAISYNPLDNLIIQELFSIIDKYLPVEMREDYLRIKEGLTLSVARRFNLVQKIIEILEKYHG